MQQPVPNATKVEKEPASYRVTRPGITLSKASSIGLNHYQYHSTIILGLLYGIVYPKSHYFGRLQSSVLHARLQSNIRKL